jgi:hypothetical protein
MFSSLRKKSLVKRAALAGAVLVLLTGLLFVSCSGGGDEDLISAQQPNITAITGYPTPANWNQASANTIDLTVTASVTDGGTLSYQWYSNSGNSNSGGTAIPEGTKATITLEKENHIANGSYYFYVVVTNTNNNATGDKTALKTSSAATVIVSGGITITAAQTPEIIMQPAATTNWNVTESNTKELTINAHVTDGGTLSYHWYSNTSATNTNGTSIGTNSATLTLNKESYHTNATHYFYVVITNTNNNATTTKTATAVSNAATVTVEGNSGPALVNAAVPTISAQPQNASWNVSDATFQLSVTAGVTDGGTLSYQWYSNTSVDNSGGTVVGTDSATLSLAKANYTKDGDYHFYVVITNTITNNGDGGNKTASITSNVVTVKVTGNVFVLDSKWIGTWEPVNGGGDYRKFIAPNLTKLDFMPMGGDGISWGWAGIILDVVYFKQDDTEGLFFVQFTELGSMGYNQVGTGDYTAFYFKYDRTDSSKGPIYDLLDLAVSMGGQYGQPMYPTLEKAKEALTKEFVAPMIIIPTLYYKSAP